MRVCGENWKDDGVWGWVGEEWRGETGRKEKRKEGERAREMGRDGEGIGAEVEGGLCRLDACEFWDCRRGELRSGVLC